MHLVFWEWISYETRDPKKYKVRWELLDDRIVKHFNDTTSEMLLSDFSSVSLCLAPRHKSSVCRDGLGELYFIYRGESDFLQFVFDQRYEADKAYLYIYEYFKNAQLAKTSDSSQPSKEEQNTRSRYTVMLAVGSLLTLFLGIVFNIAWLMLTLIMLLIAAYLLKISGIKPKPSKPVKLVRSQTHAEHDGATHVVLTPQEQARMLETLKKNAYSELQTSSSKNDKPASVVGRAVAGGIIAGPAGAAVGALSAVDKNNRTKKDH